MSDTNGNQPTQSFVLPDGTITEARDEWTKAIIAWLEGRLAWHTALSPSGRRAIKGGIRRDLDPEKGIFRGQGEWAKKSKVARETLNRQLAIAVREGLFVTRSRMRPKGWVRGGQSSSIFFPNVPIDVCPGIANLEPEITPKVTPTVTPKITPTVTPKVTAEVLTDVEGYAEEVPFGDVEDYVEEVLTDAEEPGSDASAPPGVAPAFEKFFEGAVTTHDVAIKKVPVPRPSGSHPGDLVASASARPTDAGRNGNGNGNGHVEIPDRVKRLDPIELWDQVSSGRISVPVYAAECGRRTSEQDIG